jgi:hypothetical protein
VLSALSWSAAAAVVVVVIGKMCPGTCYLTLLNLSARRLPTLPELFRKNGPGRLGEQLNVNLMHEACGCEGKQV